MFKKIVKYVKESIEEMKKVTWPSQKEVKSYTILVIGVCIVVAIFLGGLDFMFTLGLEGLLSK